MSAAKRGFGSGSGSAALRRGAMDLLARREHSRFELAGKLRSRFAAADMDAINVVLDQLAAENLQSDQRFAEEYLRLRMRRGFGWLRIRADLLRRGVGDGIISDMARPDEEWRALAEKLIAFRLGESGTMARASKEHQRLFRFLQSRGFSAETAHGALRRHIRAAS